MVVNMRRTRRIKSKINKRSEKGSGNVAIFPKKALKTRIILMKELPKLSSPILIEGLPGIGFVGKLAADTMVEELKAEKIAELHSHRFPHQVLIERDGSIKLLKNEIYLSKRKGGDLIILVGDVQPTSPEAQHEVMNAILDFFESIGGKTIFTLGGYSIGKIVEKPRVLGAVTDKKLIPLLKKHHVVCGGIDGSIVGAAGLLLGIGKLRGMEGACLMGETHGSYIDHKAAKCIIEVLNSLLQLSIDTTKLEKKVKESEEVIKKLEEEARKGEAPVPNIPVQPPQKPETLTYIR